MEQLNTFELFFWGHPFEFEPNEGDISLSGKLLLDNESRRLLRHLLKREGDDWYLDEDGERLDSDALFEKSPWSMESSSGKAVKLLCRILNIQTGDIHLSTPDTYGGELFKWVRRK